jgi:hypothetical protein
MSFRAPKRETPKEVQIKTIKDPRRRAKKSLGSLKNTPKRYPGPKKAPTVPKKGSSRESLMKDKAQHSEPPFTNKFRSEGFDIENIIYFFYKTCYLDVLRRSTVLSLPLHLVFPGPHVIKHFRAIVHDFFNKLESFYPKAFPALSNIYW